MILPAAKIRALGFDWPGSKDVEDYEVSSAQGVDLDATLHALEQGLSVYDGQLREMRDYSGRWGAKVTGPQGEYVRKAGELRRGIATIKGVLAKASR
jgi:hypothetical protein